MLICIEFINVLSAYLIGAEEYSWFTCSVHYFAPENQLWFDEYSQPLGEPLGIAYYILDTWYREYHIHLSKKADVE